jgi:nucleotide-binding universal stress UspA family protein
MFKKILVCLDGSDLAEQILPYAIEQALRFESEMILCRVVAEPTITSIGIPGFPAVTVETSQMAKQATKHEIESISYLKTLADKLQSDRGISVQCAAVFGPPGEAIVKYAAENKVDLIALATHGRSSLGRALLGSVADYVIRQSRIPIFLIRPMPVSEPKNHK